MEIAKVIKSILIAQDRLYIENFGTLKTKFKSAQILSNGEILPPTKQIYIDVEDNEKDNNLLNGIMNEGISKEEAEERIKKFVNEIKQRLDNNQNFEIENLGFIFKNKEGSYEFNQTTKESLILETVGFDSIKTTEIEPAKVNKTAEKNEKTKNKKEEKVKVTEKKKPKEKVKKATVKSKKDEHTKTKKFNSYIAPIVIAVVAIIAVIYFFDPIKNFVGDIYAKYINKENTDIKNTDTLVTNNQVTDTIQFNLDKEYKKLLDAKIGDIVNVDLGNNFKKFYIIVGSFTSRENAKQMMIQMKNMGYNPVTVYQKGQTYYRVSIGAYNNADTVISEYRNYTTKYGQSWILINKK